MFHNLKKMRKFLIMLPIAVLFLSGCKTPTAIVNPRQAGDDMTIAGFGSGITERMEFHENSGFFYRFDYDKENLYLMVATSDRDLQRKIVYFGLAVWTDRTGGHNKNQGFRFPPEDNLQNNLQVVAPAKSPDDLSSLLERTDKIELIGIYGNSVRTVKRRDSQIRIDAGFTDDMLIYRATVPFGLLEHGYDPAGRGKMSIGLETGHFEAPSSARRAQDFDGRIPADRRRPHGGMSGRMPGQSPGMMTDRSQVGAQRAEAASLSRPSRLWIDLDFARTGN
jgi:hypothetical protein